MTVASSNPAESTPEGAAASHSISEGLPASDATSGDLSASDATPEDLAASAVPKVWTDIVRYRANYGTGYLGTWFGLSHMSRRDRLQRMMARTQTQRVLQAIDGLSVGEVEHLQALANVNAERAQLAFRTTLILNFSSPFAVLIGLGQLFPATAKMVIRELEADAVLGPMVVYIAITVMLTVLYAWIRHRDAMELRDIITIALAKVRSIRAP